MWLESNSGAGVQAAALDPTASESKQESIVRKNSWFGKVFSFPVVLGALLVVLTVLTVRGRFNDPDMWWHLKTGEIIWNTHSIPRVDVFSYTAAGQPWTAQEWLSELTIYGAYRLGGYTGLMLWLCVAGSLVVLAGYLLSALYSRNVKVAFLGGLIVWFFGTVGFAIRPHLIGYLMLIGELLVLHLGRTRDGRWFFALPALFALWINFHSSFVFGLIVLGIVLACSFLEFECGLLVSRRWDRDARKTLAIASGFSLAALFLNPIGPTLIWYPINVMATQQLNIASVAEWQPLPADDMRAWALLGLAALIFLVPVMRRIEIQLDELCAIALAFALAVQHQRMLFVFALLVAPVVCRLLCGPWILYEPDRDRVVPNAVVIALALLTIVIGFPSSRNLSEQVVNSNPVGALNFIKRSGLSGRMLNEYVYGGYLIWAAPEHKVFIDGRADLYDPAGILAQYGRWATVKEDPRLLLDRYGIRLCLLSKDHPMAHVMPTLTGWRAVYIDSASMVFARKG